MSERGVIAIDRGVFDHDCFADEPFTEREAWMWLIAEAAWKARTRRIGRVVVNLARGQLAASLRFMAERWGWNKDKVDRFLARLKNRDMIATDSATGISVITICNYNNYQKVSLPDATSAATQTETEVRQQRDKRESIKNIEVDSEANASDAGGVADVPRETKKPVYTDSRHELWGEAVPILVSLGASERAARSNIGRWLRDVKDDCATVLGAIQRARDERVIDPIPWITRALQTNGKPNGKSSDNRFRSALDKLREHVAEDGGGEEGRGPVAGLLPSR